MNRNIDQGQWDQIKGRVHQFWNRLSQHEVEALDGRYESLAGKIQERYGMPREEAESQLNNFLIYCRRDWYRQRQREKSH